MFYFVFLITALLCLPSLTAAENASSCANCHEKEFKLWNGSMHQKAMEHADEKTVLGDFNNVEFVHVGFDDLLRLSESDLEKFLVVADVADLALSLKDAKSGVAEKIKKHLDEKKRNELDAEIKFLNDIGFARPGDIAAAQDNLDALIRRLEIDVDFGEKAKFFRRDGKFFVDVLVSKGNRQELEVKFTIGVAPLQQYLVELPGDTGRLQCLPFAWDTVKKRWFHLYPKEQIEPDDPLHWTKQLQNWNTMCSDCHTTNLKRNFDLPTNSYKTEWDNLGVDCLSCHGIGTRCQSPNPTDGKKSNFFSLTSATQAESIDSCAACHARRRYAHPGPKPPQAAMLDYFTPEMLDVNIYYPDGQLLEEDFEYGSFLQSKMFSKGVRCTDCHDAHSGKLKFEGNRLCAQCHAPGIYDTVNHHFHPDASKPGTKCVECHFPEVKYMVVHPRHDHSIRKPNPDLTLAMNVPNACNICHRDRSKGETAKWAKDRCDVWYGEKRKAAVGYSKEKPLPDHYGYAISGGRKGDLAAIGKLLEVARESDDRIVRPFVRASAVALLARYGDPVIMDYLNKNREIIQDTRQRDRKRSDHLAGSGAGAEALLEKVWPAVQPPCESMLTDVDGLVRFAAIDGLRNLPDADRLQKLGPLLGDPLRSVRCEAARLLASVPPKTFSDDQRKKLEAALAEYVAAQRTIEDQPAAHLNLGVLRQNLVQPKLNEAVLWFNASMEEYQRSGANKATLEEVETTYLKVVRNLTDSVVKSYEQALKLDTEFVPARINLAMCFDQRGESEKAEKEFRRVLEIDPNLGDAWYSLGLLLAQQDRLAEAEPVLKKGAELLPKQARLRYNLSVAQFRLGKKADAVETLREAIELEPSNPEFQRTLEFFKK